MKSRKFIALILTFAMILGSFPHKSMLSYAENLKIRTVTFKIKTTEGSLSIQEIGYERESKDITASVSNAADVKTATPSSANPDSSEINQIENLATSSEADWILKTATDADAATNSNADVNQAESGNGLKLTDSQISGKIQTVRVRITDGEKLSFDQIPDVTALSGFYFGGWKNNGTLYDEKDIRSMNISENITFTADMEAVGPAFDKTVEAGGYTIHVTADSGVFPEGSTLEAEEIKDEEKLNKIQEELTETATGSDAPEQKASFDISIKDKNGVDIQPDRKYGLPKVSFENIPEEALLSDHQNEGTDTELLVYHLDDDNKANKLKAKANDAKTEISVEAEHFSVYTIAVNAKEGFDQTVDIDGYKVRVQADKGVFRSGSVLKVTTDNDTDSLEKIRNAIMQSGSNKSDLSKSKFSKAFDIKILDIQGKEIQPDIAIGRPIVTFEGLPAKNSFNSESDTRTLENGFQLTNYTAVNYEVYHLNDDYSNPENLSVTYNNSDDDMPQSISLTADHFSVYFTTIGQNTYSFNPKWFSHKRTQESYGDLSILNDYNGGCSSGNLYIPNPCKAVWGDDSDYRVGINTYHSINTKGNLSGDADIFASHGGDLKNIYIEGLTDKTITFENMFVSCPNLKLVEFGSGFSNYTSLENMKRMFFELQTLPEISGLNNLKTSNVKSMLQMFYECKALKTLDLSSFTISDSCDTTDMLSKTENLWKINCPKNLTKNVYINGATYYRLLDDGSIDKSVGYTYLPKNTGNTSYTIVRSGTGGATFTTITFNTNGGTAVASRDYITGSKITTLPTTTRDGYNFAGWYKDSKLYYPWNTSTDTVSSATTLYAKWTAKAISATVPVTVTVAVKSDGTVITPASDAYCIKTTSSNLIKITKIVRVNVTNAVSIISNEANMKVTINNISLKDGPATSVNIVQTSAKAPIPLQLSVSDIGNFYTSDPNASYSIFTLTYTVANAT